MRPFTRRLALLLAMSLPSHMVASEPWQIEVDGPGQAADVNARLEAKRQQLRAIESVVAELWDSLYEVNLSSESARIFTNLVTPDRVDYWVQLDDPTFSDSRMRAVGNLMEDRRLTSDNPEARYEIRWILGEADDEVVVWHLYPETYEVLMDISHDLTFPFVCRVVLLDSDNGILAMANEYLNLELASWTAGIDLDSRGERFSIVREVSLRRPRLYTWAQVPSDEVIDRLGATPSDEGANLSQQMAGTPDPVANVEDVFFERNFGARHIRFFGLPVSNLPEVARVRVLRPSDTLLLYRGAE